MNEQAQVAEMSGNGATEHAASVSEAKFQMPETRPMTQIAIAIDVDYVVGRGGGFVNEGIYMMDNRASEGSTGEGTLELSTVCPVNHCVGWTVYPVDQEGKEEDSVTITGFIVTAGSVFGSEGRPEPYMGNMAYWVGEAMNAGSQTYHVRILAKSGRRHRAVNVEFDPYITAR